MRLRKAILTASLIGFAGWTNATSEAGDLFGLLGGQAQCDQTCDPANQPRRASKLWNYHHWHDKTMHKRKTRLHAVHQWQRWFLNPVVTPDQSCNYGYFETQWNQAPFQTYQACPPIQPGAEMPHVPAYTEPPAPEPATSSPSPVPPSETAIPDMPEPPNAFKPVDIPPLDPFQTPEIRRAPGKPITKREMSRKPETMMLLEEILAEKTRAREIAQDDHPGDKDMSSDIPEFEVIELKSPSFEVVKTDIPKLKVIDQEIPKLDVQESEAPGFKTLERTDVVVSDAELFEVLEVKPKPESDFVEVEVVTSGFVQLEDRVPTIVVPNEIDSTAKNLNVGHTDVKKSIEPPPMPSLSELPEELRIPEPLPSFPPAEEPEALKPVVESPALLFAEPPTEMEQLPEVELFPTPGPQPTAEPAPGRETLAPTAPSESAGHAAVGSTVRELRIQFPLRPRLSVRPVPRIGPNFN